MSFEYDSVYRMTLHDFMAQPLPWTDCKCLWQWLVKCCSTRARLGTWPSSNVMSERLGIHTRRMLLLLECAEWKPQQLAAL